MSAVSFIPIFESKSNRVKGLAFHPTQPLILAALHNGAIQMWDYRIKTLVDRFDEHDGPVRGIAFHPNQPIFVSGGDDFKIKVWNYKERRCLFTLSGHLDYIRTVEFHHEYPWILSASDDQTIRIWNWQSRQLVATLTGHSHYVMCARFSPTDDLVVSASLDQTVRLWDIQGLRRKNVVPTHEPDGIKLPNDVFGSNDAQIRMVLEGHDRGVNWVAFHPTLPLIISGADDRSIKLWRMSDTKVHEVDTLRGHYNNVSCCIFHPRAELMLSNGEDKSIRVWDMSKRTLILTHRREHDRFWIMASHPNRNLFAAGHDSGLVIFKLEKERPAYTIDNKEVVYYFKERYVRACELATGRDVPVLAVRKREHNPRSLQFNRSERAVLLNYEVEGGQYELYIAPKSEKQESEGRRGTGRCAIWFSRKNFAVLDKSNTVMIKDLQNQTIRTISPSYNVDQLFPAPNGNILLKADDKLILHDITQKTDVTECNVPAGTKFVEWSGQDKSAYVAVFSKDVLVIANGRLEVQCTVAERTRIKSGVWDDNNVFIYTTSSHIKYCLPNGDHGIIRTLDQPIYLTAVRGAKVFCIDRDIRNRAVTIDTTEYQFKQALVNKRYNEVLTMVKSANLIGQSIIGYLQQKGFPEVALHFVKDDRTKFDLAIECGNIDIALESAEKLDDPECFRRLGREALKQGNHQMVEMSYQKVKDLERLSFLYLSTGNTDNLKKMQNIATKRKEINSRFQTALMLGDVPERIKILEEAGQLPLAYLTAKTHNLNEEAERIREKIKAKSVERKDGEPEGQVPEPLDIASKIQPRQNARLLLPCLPLLPATDGDSNWPLLTMSRGPFELALQREGDSKASTLAPSKATAAQDHDVVDEEGGWEPDDAGDGQEKVEPEPQAPTEETEGGDWDLGENIAVPAQPAAAKKLISLPPEGASWPSLWCINSDLAADHVAAGSFETAVQLLTAQIGLANVAPLKANFLRIASGATAQLLMQPSTPASASYLLRNPASAAQREGLPLLALPISELLDKLQAGYRATKAGKFPEAVEQFKWIFTAIPLVTASSQQELAEINELVGICREYCLGLQTEIKRKESIANKASGAAIAELAAYFTHCNLQPAHAQLALRSAMSVCINLKNWATAYNFGRRIMDLNPPADVAKQIQDRMMLCETNKLVDEVPLQYDPRNPFVLCGISYKPIYRGSQSIQCSFCSAHFKPEFGGRVCTVCEIGRVGAKGSGLVVVRSNKRPQGAGGNRGNRTPQQPPQQQPPQQEEDFDF